jgi:catechol 2,3-dioxygenase-like lactoylglutathione lyase family enzyme
MSLSSWAAAELTLNDLVGHWRSSDPALGGPAVSTLAWEPVLDGHFLEVRYSIHRGDSTGSPPLFAGRALYRAAGEDDIEAFWADSNGDLLPIRAVIDANALVATWGSAGGKLGRTRYELDDAGTLQVTDWLWRDEQWVTFSQLRFVREEAEATGAVSGIGGFFFRGRDPSGLVAWYRDHLGIDPAPQSYDELPWRQEAGDTVFQPFADDTEYFGNAANHWMINFRVRDLDALVARLRSQGVTVEVDAETFPNGRFARLTDPEGNPIQLWEPAGVAAP